MKPVRAERVTPFGLSLSKPFDKLKANGSLTFLLNRVRSIKATYGCPRQIAGMGMVVAVLLF
jgi:hypothetical protein